MPQKGVSNLANQYRKQTRRGSAVESSVGAVRAQQVSSDSAERALQRGEARRRSAFCSLFTKVNSIISGRDVSVKLATAGWNHDTAGNNTPPAWTDGETVWISRGHFDRLMFREVKYDEDGEKIVPKRRSNLDGMDAIRVLKGLNYHELAHVLFTPRNTHKPLPKIRALMKSANEGDIRVTGGNGDEIVVSGGNIWHSFNILEDQRIETLFTAKWAASIPYFSVTIMEFILKKLNHNKENSTSWVASSYDRLTGLTHFLTHGRHYLPAEIRKGVRDLAVVEMGEDVVLRGEALLDEYRLLVFPADGDRAVEVIKEFTIWLAEQTLGSEANISPESLTNGTGGHEHIRDGSADSPAVQREARDRATTDTNADDTQSGDSDESGDSDKSGEAAGSSGDDASDADGDAATIGDPNAGSDRSDSEAGSGNKSSGSGDSQPKHPSLDDVIDGIADALSEREGEIQSDILDTLKTMADHESDIMNREASGTYQSKQFTPPTHQETQTRMRLSQSFSQLRSDAEPQWVKQVDKGRMNFPAVMSSQATQGVNLDVFDSWSDAGEDATSIEVVILLDQSASMDRAISGASGAMWVLKGACDDLDIPCTVIGYSDSHSILLSGDERVGARVGRFPTIGSTDPRGALEEAHRIFRASDRHNKLLFSVTDGEWTQRSTTKQMVREIAALGVHTSLIYLDASISRWNDAAAVQKHIDYLRERLEEVSWNGHQFGAICTSLPAMVRHVDRALATVMLDQVANAV